MSTASKFETVTYPKGHTIFKEGEAGKQAYLIKSGSVRIYKEVDGQKLELGTLGERQIFGEISVLTGISRGACVEALEESEMIVVDQKTINQAKYNCTPLVKSLLDQLVSRLHQKQHLFEEFIESDKIEGQLLRLEQSLDAIESYVNETLSDERFIEDLEFNQLLGNILVLINKKA